MATVEISFTPLPAHVRTARLVAASVARRCGVDEVSLDEVRLAVGEACSRAVDLHRRRVPGRPVVVRFRDGHGRFRAEVVDEAPDAEKNGEIPAMSLDGTGAAPLPPGMALAVVGGLVDDLQVAAEGGRTVVAMSWPVAGPQEPEGRTSPR